MVNAVLSNDYELDYEVDFRDLSAPGVKHEVTSRERFQTCARYKRKGRSSGKVAGAHRRRRTCGNAFSV